jgi:Uma2 family endonuclease
VNETRFRVPDTCVYLTRRKDKIFSTPPFLEVEVLSKDDRMSEMQERIDDYIAFGAPCVWVIDPLRKRGYVYTANGAREARDGVLRTASPDIAFALDRLVDD